MMAQTKCKYFNKKIKMLLLILMWSLMMGQHVYGISSTYNIDIVKVVAVLIVAKTHSVAICDGYDANVTGDMILSNITKITTITPTFISTLANVEHKITSTTIENNGKNNNATIYSHINENDNNSNKLPQNVVKRDQQQQSNKMNMNMKMSSPSTLSSLSEATAGAIIATVTTLPPTESILMAKDQLNKIEYKEPKNTEMDKIEKNENTEKEKSTESEISMVMAKVNYATIIADKDNMSNNNIAYKVYNSDDFKINFKDNLKNDFKDMPQSKKIYSTALAQQELISQFAIGFKKIPRVTYFTCNTIKKNKIQNNKTENNYFKRYKRANIDFNTLELITRLHSSNLMLKVVHIDHLLNQNRFNGDGTFCSDSNGGQSTLNTFSNVNWLEEILRPNLFRQIIVLNLACGEYSRRLLKMASNKTFFNSMYHWLLLEDYVFKRQTEIDDADDIENKINNFSRTLSDNKKFREEIVNDSNATMQFKILSINSSDVVGASTSGSDKLNEVISSTLKSVLSSNMSTTSNRQQQHLIDENSTISSNSTCANVTDEDDMEIIEKFLEKLNISINTELILAKRSMRGTTIQSSSAAIPFNIMLSKQANSAPRQSNDYNTLQKMDYYLLYDLWNPGLQYGGKLNISEIGYFDLTEGLQLVDWYRKSSTTVRRLNMHLANIRCLIVITHKNPSDILEVYLRTHYDTHLDSMNRFNFALLSHVRDLFNFSFILSQTSTWGYLKNGKFDGMIGELVRKQADIGGSPIFFRIERAKVIDYTARTWVARPCFIFRHPRSTKKDRIVFLQPFSNDVWVFLAICGCITIVLLWTLTRLEKKFDTEKIDPITSFYSASIVGTLLMEKPKTLRTLRDLTHSSMEIGIEDIVYNRDYFLRTKDPEAQELYEKKVMSIPMTENTGFVNILPNNTAFPTQHTKLTEVEKAKANRDILHSQQTKAHAKTNEASNWYTPQFGVSKVKRGHFAFHVDVATAYKIIANTFTEKEICDLSEIQLFPPQKMISIVQKGSPLRKAITYGLRRVTEVGLTDYERKVWHSSKPQCIKQVHTDDLRVDMQTFTSALLVLIFGYAVSLLILCLEIVHFKLWQRYTTTL